MNTTFDPSDFLAPCEVIDSLHPTIVAKAMALNSADIIETARRSFVFVRDEIGHSADCKLNPVVCRASDVLREKIGYCYAKSHLLAALLRANGIPAGLCYQRVTLDETGSSFCIHGLNAVYLPTVGWYRVDPRGNRDDIDAQFDPPIEKLAFSVALDGEYDLPDILVRPIPSVVECLTTYHDWADAYAALPDVPATESSG